MGGGEEGGGGAMMVLGQGAFFFFPPFLGTEQRDGPEQSGAAGDRLIGPARLGPAVLPEN